MSKNATICIGNSDNKLSQKEWSDYIDVVSKLINNAGYEIYFAGFSSPSAPWQNACWVIKIGDDYAHLRFRLAHVATVFHQDSIAVILGETDFVKAAV